MKSICPLIFAIAVTMLFPACSKQNDVKNDSVSWETFTSKGDHFSVSVPGMPFEQADNNDPDAPHYFYFQVSEKKSSYLVSSGKASNAQGTIDQFYDTVRDKTVSQYGALLKERALTVCGFPGRELQMATDHGTGFAVTRFFISNGRFYQMVVLVPREDQASTNVSLFLDSFKVTDVK